MLEYAALLDPKSKPLAVKKLADENAGPVLNLPDKINPTPKGVYNAEVKPEDLPPVPTYKAYRYVVFEHLNWPIQISDI